MTAPRELISAAAARLAAAGVDSARVDAELLLAHVLGVERSRLAAVDAVSAEVAQTFDALVARRAGREPLQHIVRRAPFRNVLLAVGPGVFVPRPETELLVDAVLPTLRAASEPKAVDLCAGSGALAVAIADEVPTARVYAVENSPAALVWLRRNATGTSVRVVAADVNEPALLDDVRGGVDAVVCNPPYVPAASAVAPEVRADPHDAVFAGADGLELMPAVIARAADLLRTGGVFAVEHDDSHGAAVPELLTRDGRWRDVVDRADLTGRARYAVATRTEAG
jgi:release factor glutamine methyltransferase